MTDKEILISDLNDISEILNNNGYGGWCATILKAVTLLKEQEAVEPLANEDDSYECICGAIVGWDELDASGIVQVRLNYCPFCGKLISWEGR